MCVYVYARCFRLQAGQLANAGALGVAAASSLVASAVSEISPHVRFQLSLLGVF